MFRFSRYFEWTRLYLKYVFAIAIVLITGLILTFALAGASPTNQEVESGTRTGNVSTVNDNSASGGSAVKFGSVPAPVGSCPIPDRVTVTSANNAVYPAYPVGAKVYVPDGPDPWGGCFPGPLSTGVPAGTQLTNYTGPCDITTANTIIDKKIVNCDDLRVRAQGLVITNSQITGRVYIDDTWCSTSSFTITDSKVYTTWIGTRAFMFCSYSVLRVDASGGGSMATCISCTIKDSYFHDPLEDPIVGKAHNSTVRIGQFATIEHNTLECKVKQYAATDGSGETSGCSANQTGYSHDGLPPYNSTLKRNFYAATTGGYCGYGGSTGGDGANQVHDVTYIQNVFQRGNSISDWGTYMCGWWGPITSLDLNLPGNAFTGNTWDNGKPFTTESNTWSDYCGSQPQCTW